MGEMRERTLRGELYIADDRDNAAEFARVQELLARFNGAAPGAADERDALLRRMLRCVGEGVVARPPFFCEYGAIWIGNVDAVWLGGGAIVCPGVSIGEDSVVGAGAVVSRDLPAGVLAGRCRGPGPAGDRRRRSHRGPAALRLTDCRL
jgi:maltose O-acetyltransferase